MSKAFVKDDQDDELEIGFDPIELEVDSEDLLAGPARSYITTGGFARLHDELEILQKAERPTADPARLREHDRRIRYLQKLIQKAEVVDPTLQSGDHVLFGATVTVCDEDDKTRIYRIVGVQETDFKSGKISWMSPIGKALLQGKVGDVVVLETPHGEEELEIKAIEYKPIH
jgi:transcription elongation factor GreB